MHGTRLTQKNIHEVAASEGMTAEELDKKMQKAYSDMRARQNRDYAINFFYKDEAWYEETLTKVQEIRETLPDNLSGKEKIKRLYGWIEPQRRLTMPLECDMEYAHASCVEMILTNPDLYLKVISWD